VHEVLESASRSVEGEPQSTERRENSTRFIGLLTLRSLDAGSLTLPENLTIPASASTLTVEIAYSFLPIGWGKGYATESLNAMFESCKKAVSFWTPFPKVYVRAIVNDDNPPSRRVMDKTGMKNRGVFEIHGRPVFLAGKMQEHHVLQIYGMYLLE